MSARRIFARPARYAAIAPYLWMVLFFLIPFGFVVKISLSQTAIAQPPYVPLFDLWAGREATGAALDQLSLANFRLLISDDIYVLSYLRSLTVALVATAFLLLIGYPVAYGMARLPQRWQAIAMMLVIVPFWTSFLIRIYAWMALLKANGIINGFLIWARAVDSPLTLMNTPFAVYLVMVYIYLPFMVLPLYANFQKLDETLLEAAADLGCPRWKTFFVVTLPLVLPGLAAGALLCFIPIIGEFVIPDLLGSSQTLMIGQTLWTEFFANRDWPVASAIAVVLLVLLVVPIAFYENVQSRQIEER